MVVTIGEAMSAGSSFNDFAKIGSIPPIVCANITVANKLSPSVIDNNKSPLNIYLYNAFTTANVPPTNKLTRNYLNNTFNTSVIFN